MTEAFEFIKALSTNATSTSFTANEAANAFPTSSNVFTVPNRGTQFPDFIEFIFFGVGNANETFDVRISGWGKSGGSTAIYVPSPIVEFECTLGARVGVSGLDVADTEKFVDTIAVDALYASLVGTIVLVTSPASDLFAVARVDLMGYPRWELEFDMTGATSGNALFRYIWS